MSTLQVRAAKAITELCTLHNEPRYKIGWMEQTALREACQVLADMIGELQRMHAALSRPCAPPAEAEESRDFPFYELKFIMRVLSHEGHAPREDWSIARGMAKRIFDAWHGSAVTDLKAATSTDAVRVPDGYAIVPIEPTEDMCAAGYDAVHRVALRFKEASSARSSAEFAQITGRQPQNEVWSAMLAAAPSPASNPASQPAADLAARILALKRDVPANETHLYVDYYWLNAGLVAAADLVSAAARENAK